jgi:hypothetical protein
VSASEITAYREDARRSCMTANPANNTLREIVMAALLVFGRRVFSIAPASSFATRRPVPPERLETRSTQSDVGDYTGKEKPARSRLKVFKKELPRFVFSETPLTSSCIESSSRH